MFDYFYGDAGELLVIGSKQPLHIPIVDTYYHDEGPGKMKRNNYDDLRGRIDLLKPYQGLAVEFRDPASLNKVRQAASRHDTERNRVAGGWTLATESDENVLKVYKLGIENAP